MCDSRGLVFYGLVEIGAEWGLDLPRGALVGHFNCLLVRNSSCVAIKIYLSYMISKEWDEGVQDS